MAETSRNSPDWLHIASSSVMTSDTLVHQFLECTLPKEQWTHEAHLKVGLWHVLHYGAEATLEQLRARIRSYNVACGIANTDTSGYHETITRFYVWLIATFVATVECNGTAASDYNFEHLAVELISTCGARDLILQYWSPERLFSTEARLCWQEPDRSPLKAELMDY